MILEIIKKGSQTIIIFFMTLIGLVLLKKFLKKGQKEI